MDFRDEVFPSVAESLSFSRASEDMFISQPAVTKHIKELESKLDISLFERKGNRVYLTKAGQLTYEYFKNIKLKYRELEFEIGELNNAFKGALRIGASSTISQYYIPSVIASFHKRFPEISVFLFNGNSSEMEQKLLNNEIDIALVENESSHLNIKYINFLDDEIIACTGENSIYSNLTNLSIHDLQKIPMVLREKGSGTLEVIKKNLSLNNIDIEKLNIQIFLGSTESIKNFLSNFDGIALISEKSVEKEIQLKKIKKLNIKNLYISRKFRIALPQGPYIQIPKMVFLSSFLQLILKALKLSRLQVELKPPECP